MPEASRSGKQRGGAGGMLLLCSAGIFRKTEWDTPQRRIVIARSEATKQSACCGKLRRGQENMRDAVDFHDFPFFAK